MTTSDHNAFERLCDDLLEYLGRRKAGSWSLEYAPAASVSIMFEGVLALFVTVPRFIEDGAELTSARAIAEVKRAERTRRERKRA